MKNDKALKEYWDGYRHAKNVIEVSGYKYATDTYDALAYENSFAKGYKRALDGHRKKMGA